MPTILTIEDDEAIRQGIVDSLTYFGHTVIEAGDGDAGWQLASEREYDLLLLDLALPGRPGLQILDELRALRPTQPIIILTAKGDEHDRVAGLKSGADDYVVKPFGINELMARVDAVLRRCPQRPKALASIKFASGEVDFERQEVRFCNGERVELSEKENELLLYLARHAGRAISRDELLSSVWGLAPQGISTRTIDMHIARLREKLRDEPSESSCLLTVRGKGYMWATDNGANDVA
ncbi:response regulator transcription factor [Mariniblastus sp.]|nr:response regulator transcription factor [Mariniblastus sp.]